MRTRTGSTIVAVAAFALLGLTACTPEEIQQAIEWSDAQAASESLSVATAVEAIAPVEVTPVTEPETTVPATTAPEATAPTAEVVATCETARVVMSGWPAGARIGFGYGQTAMVIALSPDGSIDHTFSRVAGDYGDTGWALWSQDDMALLDMHGPATC